MEFDTRQRILENCKTLFYENGYYNTTIKQIADAVGIASSVLFHYFTNKRHVLIEIIKKYHEEIFRVISALDDNFSPIEKQVLFIKIWLKSLLLDKKWSRLNLEALQENAPHDLTPLIFHNNFFNSEKLNFTDDDDIYSQLIKYRSYAFVGSVREIDSGFLNGSLVFNEKNIDLSIISQLNLFYNVPIPEIWATIKKMNSLVNLITFNGLKITVMKDDVAEYIGKNKYLMIYDQMKTILINEVEFMPNSSLEMNDTTRAVEWLKEKYNKVIIFTQTYNLKNPVDIKGIEYSLEKFTQYILQAYADLSNNFSKDFFVTSYVDKLQLKHQTDMLKPFEDFGIDVANTLRNQNIYYNDDHNVITHCGFIFY